MCTVGSRLSGVGPRLRWRLQGVGGYYSGGVHLGWLSNFSGSGGGSCSGSGRISSDSSSCSCYRSATASR